MSTGSCYSTPLRDNHTCVENSMKSYCPICWEVCTSRTHLYSGRYNLKCSLLTILLMLAVSFWLNKRHNCYALWSHNTFGVLQWDGINESVIQYLLQNSISESTIKYISMNLNLLNTTLFSIISIAFYSQTKLVLCFELHRHFQFSYVNVVLSVSQIPLSNLLENSCGHVCELGIAENGGV